MRFFAGFVILFLFSQLIAQKRYVPPNGVRISDTTFIDKTEVANIYWLEFLFYVQKDSTDEYSASMLPDSSVYPTIGYLRSPSFRYFPVIGVSHYQALEFCKWRSTVVSKLEEVSVTYRLPTSNEWKQTFEKFSKANASSSSHLVDVREGRYKVKHLNSNVSELLLDGVIGGSFSDESSSSTRLVKLDTGQVRSSIGFRCIAEVKD